jgi:hypothetical protein
MFCACATECSTEYNPGLTLLVFAGRSNIVDEMVRRGLQTGVDVAGRHYEFLAWSNSQLRDHGCFMYTTASYTDLKTGEVHEANIADIRRWMGDFTASKNVPKLMSRMGQCFTQAIVCSCVLLVFCYVSKVSR